MGRTIVGRSIDCEIELPYPPPHQCFEGRIAYPQGDICFAPRQVEGLVAHNDFNFNPRIRLAKPREVVRQQPECEHIGRSDPHRSAQPQILPGHGTVKCGDIALDAFNNPQSFLTRHGQRIASGQSLEQPMVDAKAARRTRQTPRPSYGKKHPQIIPIRKLCIHAITTFIFGQLLCADCATIFNS